jgi:hypothetical protein
MIIYGSFSPEPFTKKVEDDLMYKGFFYNHGSSGLILNIKWLIDIMQQGDP